MKNLIKISLITSMLLVNSYALTDSEQDTKILQNESNIQVNTDDINEDLKPRMDSVERLASDAFTTATNARIKADNNTSDITTLKTRMTNVEDNYVKQDMFFNEMTYVFNDINQNKDDLFNTKIDLQDLKTEHESLVQEVEHDSTTTSTNTVGQTIETTDSVNYDNSNYGNYQSLASAIYGEKVEEYNVDTDITTVTSSTKGLFDFVEENTSKNTSQDVNINKNTNDISIERDRNDNQQIQIDNNTSKNISQDVNINKNTNDISIERDRNDNQQIQIDNNISKNIEQDNRIQKVEDDVVILINNSNQQNSQDMKRIENKADKNSQDIKEMKREISLINKRENKKIASSNASNLEHYFLEGDNTSVTVKASNFNGESAIGMGVAYRDKNKKAVYSLGYGTDGENHSVNIKASWSFSL